MNMQKIKNSILILLAVLFLGGFVLENASAACDYSYPFPSQCDANNQNCSRECDEKILTEQCPKQAESWVCESMESYLGFLQKKCENENPEGIDCGTIASGNYYGNEAAKTASYIYGGGGGGGGGGEKCKPGFTEYSGVCFPDDTGLSEVPIKDIVFNVMQWILGIFGFIALIAFAISGIQYMTAAGSENAIETAKRNMKWSIVGVAVGLGGLVIVWAIDWALRGMAYF